MLWLQAERHDDVEEEKGLIDRDEGGGVEGAVIKDHDNDPGDPDHRLEERERERTDGSGQGNILSYQHVIYLNNTGVT